MSQMQRIGKTATTVSSDEYGTNVTYHATRVVSFKGCKVTLRTGGWRTNTTKTHMNQAARQFNLGFYVAQKDFAWTVHVAGGASLPFDGDIISFEVHP